MNKYKAVVVDDQQIISESLKELLKKTGKFESVINFYNVDDTVKELEKSAYDFLFTDLIMPGTDVYQFIGSSRRRWPELMIMVVSSITELMTAKEVFTLGANAYISKYVGSFELSIAMEKVQQGEKYISSDLGVKFATSIFADRHNVLTKREIEILVFVARGHTIVETAELLHLSHYTIATHRRNIMEKLNLHSVVELVKYAYENKII